MEEILEKIRAYTDDAHGSQMRKYTPERYIVHPVRVMQTCRNYTNSLPVLAAALLHDVLEDTSVTEDGLLNFLKTVMNGSEAEDTLRLVVEMTDVYVKEDYPQMNRKLRKEKELERIEATSPEAQTIKYADIIDNCTEITVHDRHFAPLFLRECLAVLKKADKGNPELYERALEVVREGLSSLNRRH